MKKVNHRYEVSVWSEDDVLMVRVTYERRPNWRKVKMATVVGIHNEAELWEYCRGLKRGVGLGVYLDVYMWVLKSGQVWPGFDALPRMAVFREMEDRWDGSKSAVL